MQSVIYAVTLVVSAIVPAARGEVPPDPDAISGAFVRMLARRDEAPTESIVLGEPDPVAVRIAKALEAQRIDAQMLARRPSPLPNPARSR